MPEGIASFLHILGSAGRQLFDGMPLVIPSFVHVVGCFGRQLFHGMPQVISPFVDVVGSVGRQLFDGMPVVGSQAPILLFNLDLENTFLWLRELLPISRMSSVQELSGLGNCTGLRFQKYLQDPRHQFCYSAFTWKMHFYGSVSSYPFRAFPLFKNCPGLEIA